MGHFLTHSLLLLAKLSTGLDKPNVTATTATDALAASDYHIFYVHPPSPSIDASLVLRVEMEIQDLERDFEEHEEKMQEAQVSKWLGR
jgi:hypothetical protein